METPNKTPELLAGFQQVVCDRVSVWFIVSASVARRECALAIFWSRSWSEPVSSIRPFPYLENSSMKSECLTAWGAPRLVLQIDKNGDGSIDMSELKSALDTCGFKLPGWKVRQMIDDYRNKRKFESQGRLTFEEFERVSSKREWIAW